jgi:ABC-type multidrug transport system fused ATPase/permease subunit
VTEAPIRQPSNLLAIFRRLMGYLGPYRGKLIATSLLAVAAQAAALAIPALTGHVIDDALRPHDR